MSPVSQVGAAAAATTKIEMFLEHLLSESIIYFHVYDLFMLDDAATAAVGTCSVTRFGEISPLWQIFDSLFQIWKNAEATLANL